jgi:hypothetical protein
VHAHSDGFGCVLFEVEVRTRIPIAGALLLVGLPIVLPVFAYDNPLSSSSIRDAYFLGTGQSSAEVDFLKEYTHALPKLSISPYTSLVRLETPFSQIAEHARLALNYHVQDAEQEFLGKPAVLRVQLDICDGHNEPAHVRFKITQNDKELVPGAVERSPWIERERYGTPPVIGEHVKLQFEAEKIEPSPLTVEIETPDGQHAETTFDLAKLR